LPQQVAQQAPSTGGGGLLSHLLDLFRPPPAAPARQLDPSYYRRSSGP